MSDHRHDTTLGTRRRRALSLALAANGALLVVEVGGGLAFGSLALLADAAHLASDVLALGIALAAQSLMERPASVRHTYGLMRVEILGALANGTLLAALALFIGWEAVRRIGAPEEVGGAGVAFVGVVGLGVNAASAWLLARTAGASLNMRGAVAHMFADAAGSLGAIVAGVAVVLWGAEWADPVVSLGIGALILWSAWRLLRDTVHILLEGAPRDLDARELEDALRSDPSVEDVHHLHVWNIASETPALSAHVVLGGDTTLHEAQEHGDRLKAELARRYGIRHATLELECHACEPAS
jgi:cobalt-zinc-cadmium efflux system protein